MRGLWSVITWKCCKPDRNILHFITDHVTARSSSSMTAYLDSVGVRKRDPACTRVHCPVSDCCWRTNPTPCLLASVHNWVGFAISKYARVGTSTKCRLALVNALSCSNDHRNSFFVLSKGRNGSRSSATVAVLEDNWLTKPKKDRRSVRFVGAGNFDIASVTEESMW